MSETRAHAILSASSSHKWINCTPSARLEERFPNASSEYAKEGTLAHAISELKLKSYITNMTKKEYEMAMNVYKRDKAFTSEMEGYAEEYVGFIKEKALQTAEKPYISIEAKVDFENYVPEGFGTVDCLMVKNKTLYVIDYKYGKGVAVDVTNNTQLILYALGAYNKIQLLYKIEKVVLCIFQPRINNISEQEISLEELLKWGNIIKTKASMAYAGLGEYNPGEHCRFCRAKEVCTARREKAEEAIKEIEIEKNSITQSWASQGAMLKRCEWIEGYLKEIRSGLVDAILSGEEVPDWKVVEGRSNRTIADLDKAFKVLTDYGVEETMLYKREPLGLTELESLLTKKKFNELIGDFVEKPKGKPTLVLREDKREPYQKTSAEEDFKSI